MQMRNDKVLGRFRLGLIAGRYCKLFFFQMFSPQRLCVGERSNVKEEEVKDSIYNIEGFARGKNKWLCTTLLI